MSKFETRVAVCEGAISNKRRNFDSQSFAALAAASSS